MALEAFPGFKRKGNTRLNKTEKGLKRYLEKLFSRESE